MTTVLIDGDILLYQVALALEESVEFSHDVVAVWVDMAEARQLMRQSIEKIMDQTKAQRPVICLTDTTNFRKEILETYKANRAGNRKPIAFGPLKNFLQDHYTCVVREGLEADDVMGILATHPDKGKRTEKHPWAGRKVIYSADKDLLQIPGWHWSPKDDKVIRVTKAAGDHQHWLQMLTGDRTDNYFGCPGVGPVKAEEIIQKGGKNPWTSVVKAYEKAGLTDWDAIVQGRVSRILRWSDYDHNRREVKLWNPPKRRRTHRGRQKTATHTSSAA